MLRSMIFSFFTIIKSKPTPVFKLSWFLDLIIGGPKGLVRNMMDSSWAKKLGKVAFTETDNLNNVMENYGKSLTNYHLSVTYCRHDNIM